MQSHLATLQRHATAFANSMHESMFGKTETKLSKEAQSLNARLVQKFPDAEASVFKMSGWEVLAEGVKFASSIALIGLGMFFASTLGFTTLGVATTIFLVTGGLQAGLEVFEKVSSAFESVYVTSSHQRHLEMKEKKLDELNKMYEELVGDNFESTISDEMKATLKKATGHNDVRSMIPLMSDAMYDKKIFEAKEAKLQQFKLMFDKYDADSESDISDRKRAALRTLEMMDSSYNKFIMHDYCPAMLEFAFSIYKLKNPDEKSPVFSRGGEFLSNKVLNLTNEACRSMDFAEFDIPVFRFTGPGTNDNDFLTVNDICKPDENGKFRGVLDVVDSLTDSFSLQAEEVKLLAEEAEKKAAEKDEAAKTDETAKPDTETVKDATKTDEVDSVPKDETAKPDTETKSPSPTTVTTDVEGDVETDKKAS